MRQRKGLVKNERLLFSTVRIAIQLHNGDEAIGTSFFYKHEYDDNKSIDLLITNCHVIEGAKIGDFQIHTKNSTLQKPEFETIRLEDFENKWVKHPNPEIDLCCIQLTDCGIENPDQIKAEFITNSDIPSIQNLSDLSALEDILMVGYPEGMWDEKNNFPLIRRGVTATHPNIDYEGKPITIVDIATFGGNSGSPIFILDQGNYTTKYGTGVGGGRFFLLGILYAGPEIISESEVKIVEAPRLKKKLISQFSNPLHLGFIVKSNQLNGLAEYINTIKEP